LIIREGPDHHVNVQHTDTRDPTYHHVGEGKTIRIDSSSPYAYKGPSPNQLPPPIYNYTDHSVEFHHELDKSGNQRPMMRLGPYSQAHPSWDKHGGIDWHWTPMPGNTAEGMTSR